MCKPTPRRTCVACVLAAAVCLNLNGHEAKPVSILVLDRVLPRVLCSLSHMSSLAAAKKKKGKKQRKKRKIKWVGSIGLLVLLRAHHKGYSRARTWTRAKTRGRLCGERRRHVINQIQSLAAGCGGQKQNDLSISIANAKTLSHIHIYVYVCVSVLVLRVLATTFSSGLINWRHGFHATGENVKQFKLKVQQIFALNILIYTTKTDIILQIMWKCVCKNIVYLRLSWINVIFN